MAEFNRNKRYGRKDSSRFSYEKERRFSREGSAKRNFEKPEFRKQMHSATCDKCGKRCEVPFKPRGNKPVYCSDCFRKGEKPESWDQYKKEFEIINEKLDIILEALGSN